jgi:hypothetical protein
MLDWSQLKFTVPVQTDTFIAYGGSCTLNLIWFKTAKNSQEINNNDKSVRTFLVVKNTVTIKPIKSKPGRGGGVVKIFFQFSFTFSCLKNNVHIVSFISKSER